MTELILCRNTSNKTIKIGAIVQIKPPSLLKQLLIKLNLAIPEVEEVKSYSRIAYGYRPRV